MNDLVQLEKLGMDPEMRQRIDPACFPGYQLGRVISVNKNSCVVSAGTSEIYSELSGKFLFSAQAPEDFPAVGDWVYLELFNDESLGIIHQIVPRKSLLKRKSAGKKVDYQLIAANIDTGIIMQSVDSNYNLRRLERYLVMINESNINPVLLLSKSDLASPEEMEKKESEISGIFPELKLISFSNRNPSDIRKLLELLIP
ncbi:MAG TPA: GTPase RsgA, partial [Ignavibacteriaceae bacterium]|nr:GTPase RsgA [Ignavibacteriaceae bacterium]